MIQIFLAISNQTSAKSLMYIMLTLSNPSYSEQTFGSLYTIYSKNIDFPFLEILVTKKSIKASYASNLPVYIILSQPIQTQPRSLYNVTDICIAILIHVLVYTYGITQISPFFSKFSFTVVVCLIYFVTWCVHHTK